MGTVTKIKTIAGVFSVAPQTLRFLEGVTGKTGSDAVEHFVTVCLEAFLDPKHVIAKFNKDIIDIDDLVKIAELVDG